MLVRRRNFLRTCGGAGLVLAASGRLVSAEVKARRPIIDVHMHSYPVLMHCGYPYLEDTIAILMQYPQVNADLGALDWLLPREAFHSYLHALTSAGFAKRLMFGSDHMYWPDAIGLAIEAVESAPFLSDADKNDIFHGNAVRFYKLDA